MDDMSLLLGQFSNSKSWVIPFVGIAMVTTALMMRLRAKRRSGYGKRVTPQEQLERVRQQKGMRADLEEMMVEIEQLARRFGAQLDAKTLQLEQVIREADERIAELRRLEKGGGDQGEQAEADGAGYGEERAKPQAAGTRQVDDDSSHAAAPDPQPPEPAPPVDPLAQKVYQLSDAGQKATDIARQLNEHIGKVELILALRDA